MLLIRDRRRLFWVVTAFTVSHSVTLAAASLGWVSVPPPPVEAIIALSIVFLAYELTLHPDAGDPLAERFPWVVSFGFGLIHGLGFAGALREIGLPEGDIPLALLAFNIGVELGQIPFIVLALGVFAGYGMGSLASFWVIQRVSGFGSSENLFGK